MKFVKPNRCDNSGPNCVEVAHNAATGERVVRDSKNPTGPVLTFTGQEWSAFEESIRAGQQF